MVVFGEWRADSVSGASAVYEDRCEAVRAVSSWRKVRRFGTPNRMSGEEKSSHFSTAASKFVAFGISPP
jgi:hypothetical protein